MNKQLAHYKKQKQSDSLTGIEMRSYLNKKQKQSDSLTGIEMRSYLKSNCTTSLN